MLLTTVLAAEAHIELPMPAIVYGIIAIVIFGALGFVMWTYRDVANRHSHKAEAHAAEHAGAPGATTHASGHH